MTKEEKERKGFKKKFEKEGIERTQTESQICGLPSVIVVEKTMERKKERTEGRKRKNIDRKPDLSSAFCYGSQRNKRTEKEKEKRDRERERERERERIYKNKTNKKVIHNVIRLGVGVQMCGSVIEKCTVINLDVNQAYDQNRKSSLNMFGYIRC